MNINLHKYSPILVLFLSTMLVYFPVLTSMVDLFNRGNDLQEFFWPIIYFVKQQILVHHTFPLWNNLFLSGTPLLPDPQSPLFYFPNVIFLLLPLEYGFLSLFLLHTFFGGLGVYLACQRGFRFSKIASLLAAILYITTPKLAGYLEAGHVGLVYTLAWLPYVVWASVETAKRSRFRWSLLLGISMAALYYAHPVTFAIAAVGSFLLVLATAITFKSSHRRAMLFLTISALLTFGLTAVQLLPQLEWMPHTTRSLLLNDRDVYPKWSTRKEFLEAVFVPWTNSWQNIWKLDTEKWFALGILPTLIALLGFWKLSRKHKLTLLFISSLVLLLMLNNVSPIYNLLLAQDWYVLARVATRVAVILVLITVFLFGYAIDKACKKRLIFSLAAFAIAESLALSWIWMFRPIPDQTGRFVPEEVYQFLENDKERFRVFCVTRCLSQRKAAQYGLELVEGYNTLQQINYYKQAWQLTGAYWNSYTLSIPPIGTYTFEKPQPDAKSLGEFNTKYVISPYGLRDKNFALEKEINGLSIYKNLLARPRAYNINDKNEYIEVLEITRYTPNEITVNTSNSKTDKLVLAEVYSPGWKAYVNGSKETAVLEKPNTLRQIDLPENAKYVTLRYSPKSYNFGRFITLATIIFLISFLLFSEKIKDPPNKSKETNFDSY